MATSDISPQLASLAANQRPDIFQPITPQTGFIGTPPTSETQAQEAGKLEKQLKSDRAYVISKLNQKNIVANENQIDALTAFTTGKGRDTFNTLAQQTNTIESLGASISNTPEKSLFDTPTEVLNQQQVNQATQLTQASQALKGALGNNSPTGQNKAAGIAAGSTHKAQQLNTASSRIKASLDPVENNPMSLPWDRYVQTVKPENVDLDGYLLHQSKIIQEGTLSVTPNETYKEDVGTAIDIGVENVKGIPATLGLATALGFENIKPEQGKLVPYAISKLLDKSTGGKGLPFGITDTLKESVVDTIQAVDELKKEYSLESQASFKNIQDSSEDRKKAFEAKGDNSLSARVMNQLDNILPAVGDYLINPRALGLSATESVPDLAISIVGGGIVSNRAKTIVAKEVKDQLEKEAVKDIGSETKDQIISELAKPETKEIVESFARSIKTELGDKSVEEFAQQAARKAGERFAIGTTGLTEGAVSARDALQEAQNTSFEQLEKDVEGFKESVEKGISKFMDGNTSFEEAYKKSAEEQRTLLAEEHFIQTFAAVAITAGVIGKFTGADATAGNVLNKARSKGLGNRVEEGIKNAAQEGVEEGLQGGVGTLVQNISAQDTFDPNRSIEEGVGEATGSGAIVGAAVGGAAYGGINTAPSILKGTGKVLGAVGRPIVKAGNKKIDSIKAKSAAEAKVQEAISEDLQDYTLQEQVEKSSVPVPIGTDLTTPEGKATIFRNAKAIINNVESSQTTKDEALLLSRQVAVSTQSSVQSLQEDVFSIDDALEDANLPQPEREALNADKKFLEKKIKEYNRVLDIYAKPLSAQFQARKDSLDIGAIQKRLDLVKDITTLADNPESFGSDKAKITYANPQQVVEDVQSLSIAALEGKVDTKELRKIAAKGNLAKSEVTQLVTTADIVDRMKSTQEVNQDVINGGDGYVGLNQYIKIITEALSLGNTDIATRSIGRLNNFNQQRKAKLAAFESALAESKKLKAENPSASAQIDIPRYKRLNGLPAFVRPNSDLLVNKIKEESVLIDDIYTSLSQKINAKIPVETQTTTPTNTESVFEKAVLIPETPVPVNSDGSIVAEATQTISDVNQGNNTESTLTLDQEDNVASVTDPILSQDELATTDLDLTNTEQNTSTLETNQEIPIAGTSTYSKPEQTLNTLYKGIPVAEDADVDTKHISGNVVTKHYSPIKKQSLVNTTEGSVVEKISFLSQKEFNDGTENKFSKVAYKLLQTIVSKVPALTKVLDAMSFNPTEVKALRDRGFAHKKLVYMLTNENGEFTPETKEIMILSGLEWIENEGFNSITNMDNNIASLLNQNDFSNFKPNREQYQALKDKVGISTDLLVDQLGKAAIRNLGIEPSQDTPENVVANLQTSIGSFIYAAFNKAGYLDSVDFPISDLIALGGKYTLDPDAKINPKTKQSFNKLTSVRLNLDKLAQEFGVPREEVLNVFSETDGVLSSILKPEKIVTKAIIGEVPTADNISRTTSSGQIVPKQFFYRAVKAAQNPLFLNQNMGTVFDVLGEKLIGQMLGEKDPENTIPELLPKVEGKNQTIANDIKNYKNFAGRMLAYVLENGGKVFETAFYQTYSFGSQFRMNAQGTDINYQRSKLHRYMIGMESSTIDLTDPQQVGLFKMVLAQNLKVLDDRGAQETFVALENFLNTPQAERAIATLRDIVVNKNQKPDQADLDNLLEVVDQGGEETASLKALVSYMEFQEATGQPSFETTLTFELDGKSNGPFNALVQIGLTGNNPTALLAGAGLFLDGTESYSEFKQNPANFDFYELVMAKVHKLFENLNLTPVSQTLMKYTGTLTVVNEDGNLEVTPKGRKFVKPDVTTFTYAAGERARHKAIGSSIQNNILDELQSYQGQDINTDSYKVLIRDINQMFGTGFSTSIPPSKVIFNQFHQSNFDKNVADQIGKTITTATEQVLPSLAQNSKTITNAGNIIYSMFQAQYNQAFKELHASLVEQGAISKYESLSLKQIADIKANLIKAMPIYNLLQSADENSGVQTIKTTTSKVSDSYPVDKSLYSSDNPTNQKQVFANQKISTPSHSSVRTFESPGAGTLAVLTLASGDAATMGTVTDLNKALNIFDAQVTAVDTIDTATSQLNIAGFNALNNFDLLSSVADRFSTSLNMLLPLLDVLSKEELLPLKKEAFNQLNNNAFYNRATGELIVFPKEGKAYPVKDIDLPSLEETKEILQTFSQELSKEAQLNAEAKQQLLKQPLYFAQFGGIGSGVRFKSGRIVAESKPDDLETAMSKADKEITELVNELPDEVLNEPTSLDEDFAKQELKNFEPVSKTSSVTEKNPASTGLQALFKSTDTITVDQLKELYTGRYKLIFEAVMRMIPSNYRIVKLSGNKTNTIVTAQDGEVSSDKYAAYHDGDVGVIFINDVNKPKHGMHLLTVLHELIHAATSQTIAKYEQGIRLPAGQRKILKDLDDLRVTLQKQLNPTPKSRMAYALFDLNEFFAWGLTDSEVGKTLAEQATSPRKTSVIKKAAGALLTGIRKLLGIPAGTLTNARAQLVDGFDTITQPVTQGRTVPTLSQPQQVAQDIRQMDLISVFDRLRVLSREAVHPDHLAHLKDTLQNAIIKVINPVKLQFTDAQIANTTEEDMVFARLEADVTSDLMVLKNAGFRLSGEEALVYGLYSPIVNSALNEFSWDTREIRKLYNFAAKELSWQSFIDQNDIIETAEDKLASETKAQSRYNVIFGAKASSGINNGLRNFITLAQTNANFRSVLGNLQTPTFATRKIRGEGFVKTISNLVSALMDFMNNILITKGSAPNVKSKLDKLAQNIRYREAVEKNKLQKHASLLGVHYSRKMNQLNKGIIKGIDFTLDNIIKRVSGPKTIEGVVRIAGALVSQKQAQKFAYALDSVQNSLSKGNQGFLSSLYDDMKGTNKSNWRLHKILLAKNRMIDQAGKHLKDRTSRLLRDEYVQALTEKEETAITKTVLKTDLGLLLDHGYTLNTIEKLLKDPVALQREIQKTEQQIRSTGNSKHNSFFVNQTKELGKYMATGFVENGHLLFNAESIASAHGINNVTIPDSEQQRVQPLIDALASLYALNNTESKYKLAVAHIIRREGSRTDGKNGFVFTLDLHKLAKQNAKETVFQNQTKSIIKGYTKELTSPYISVITRLESEEKELGYLGYKKIKILGTDKHDIESESQAIFVSEEGGDAGYLQGVLSLASRKRKGRSLEDSASVKTVYDLRVASGYIDSLFTDTPQKLSGPILVPSLNENGEKVGYRYLASEQTKDDILGKDNRFAEVLGAEFTSTQNKVRSVDINSQLLNALKDQYDADVEANNLERYVYISADSRDRKLQEIYRLLPREARQEAKELFGKAGIAIRNDLVSDAFGYRKFTMAQLWDKNSDLPNIVQKTFGVAVQTIYGKKMLPYAIKLERGIQELVKEIKDLIVIKSIVVLRDAIISNTAQLKVLHGVSNERIFKGQARAYIAAEEYMKNEKRIFELNLRGKINPLNQIDQKELENLIDAQARNPEKELIEAGLLQTIIEDVDITGGDIFGYKGSLQSKITPYTNKIPQNIRNALSEVTLSQGSSGHIFLSKVTQLSDFAARSVLYEHLTQVEGKSKDQALMEIQEAFVNYDRNLNKGLQYMSDMGIFWFAKYFIRMQKVILRSFREQPARVLALLYGEYLLDMNVPTPVDSFALTSNISGKFGLLEGIERASDAHPIAKLY